MDTTQACFLYIKQVEHAQLFKHTDVIVPLLTWYFDTIILLVIAQ